MSNSIINAERVYQEAQQGEFNYFTTFLTEHNEIFNYEYNNKVFDITAYGFPRSWMIHSDNESLFYYIIKYNREDIFDLMRQCRHINNCLNSHRLNHWWYILKDAIYLQNKSMESLALPYVLWRAYIKNLPYIFCQDPILFVRMYQIIDRIRRECPETHPTSPVCFRCNECMTALESQLKLKSSRDKTNQIKSEGFYNEDCLKLFEKHGFPIAENENELLLQLYYSKVQVVKATGVILRLVLKTLPKDIIDFVIVPYL